MSLQIKHYFLVKHGQIQWRFPDLLNQELMGLEGQEGYCLLKKKDKKATHSQYGYYRGAILPACFESEMFKGSVNKKDDIHDEYFAPLFLSYTKMVNFGGKQKEITITKSLADLNVQEMTDFISRVLAECDMLGIYVPPSEMFYNRYYQK